MLVFVTGYAALILGLLAYIFSFSIKNEESARKFKMFSIAITFVGITYILIAIAGGDPPDEILNLFIGPIIGVIFYLALNDIWKWFKTVHATVRVVREKCPLFEKK